MNSVFPPHPSAASFNAIAACRIPPQGYKGIGEQRNEELP
jgi:hypothetical protein